MAFLADNIGEKKIRKYIDQGQIGEKNKARRANQAYRREIFLNSLKISAISAGKSQKVENLPIFNIFGDWNVYFDKSWDKQIQQ